MDIEKRKRALDNQIYVIWKLCIKEPKFAHFLAKIMHDPQILLDLEIEMLPDEYPDGYYNYPDSKVDKAVADIIKLSKPDDENVIGFGNCETDIPPRYGAEEIDR